MTRPWVAPASGLAAGFVGFLAILLIRNDIIGALGVGLIAGVFLGATRSATSSHDS